MKLSDTVHRTILDRSRTWIYRSLLLPLNDTMIGSSMMRRLRFLEKAQYWPRERILDEQSRLLQNTLAIAYHQVPFYHELFDRHNADIRSIRSREDLGRLPLVSKKLFRAVPEQMVKRPTGQRLYKSYTSGSTGENFFVFEDIRTAGWYRATFFLALEWAGWSVGDLHMQTGMNTDRSTLLRLKDVLLRCHYVNAHDLSPEHLLATLSVMEKHSIRHVFGYPGSLYYLALEARKAGWNRPLRSLVTWGDTLLPAHRAVIESTFAAKVYDTYGCSEGFQVSAQCGHASDYHLHDLDVIVEYLGDDDSCDRLDGAAQVIVTRLEAGPMPLIRYRTGDLALPGSAEHCPCGRGLGRMSAIKGRESDTIVTPSGNRLIVHFFTGILEHFQEVSAFQVVQDEPDALLVRVVPATHQWSSDTGEKIRQSMLTQGAGDMKIRVEPTSAIPLSHTGKRKFVISYSAGDVCRTTQSPSTFGM